MKRFSKLHKLGAFILALVLTFTQFMPYMGTVLAADDTTGWNTGSAGSTITGNATDGFELSLVASGWGANTSYTTATSVSNIEVTMDLSRMGNQEFNIGFGDGRYGLQNWSTNKIFFMVKRNGTSLWFYGHAWGGGEVGKVELKNFDFNTSHKFEFLQDENGKWQPALDGTIYKMEKDGVTSIDDFVNGMIVNSPKSTVVNFTASSGPILLKGIKFSEKTASGWTLGSNSVVAGTETSGQTLSLAGNSWGANTSYAAFTGVANLKVTMDLSGMGNQEFNIGFGDGRYGLQNWSTNKVFFMVKRSGTSLHFYGHAWGGGEVGKVELKDFDFNTPHTLEFLQDENGKWQPALDETIYKMEKDGVTSIDDFVNGMLVNSPKSTVVNFTAGSGPILLKGIKFSEKTASGWTLGSNSVVAGTETSGQTLSLAGNSWGANTSYAAFTSVANLKVTMDLSGMGNQEFNIGFGDGRYGLQNWSTNKVFFMVKRSGTSLHFYGHAWGGGEVGKVELKDFDFNTPHTLEFLQDENGKWQPALDETIYKMEKDGVTSIDDFVNGMLVNSPEMTAVNFTANSGTILLKGIKFSEKTTPGWIVGEKSAVAGTADAGWTLAAGGLSTSEANVINYYEAGIVASKLMINMDLEGLSQNEYLWFMLGSNKDNIGIASWNGERISLYFRKTTDNELEFAAYSGGSNIWGNVTIGDIDLKNVEFTFKYNGEKWVPAINGVMYSDIDCTEFVNGMATASPNKTIIGFGPQCSGTNKHLIKNIKFTSKDGDQTDYTNWKIGNNSQLEGNAATGWTLTAAGNLFNGSKYNSYYTTNIVASRLKISMNLSELSEGQNLWLLLGNTNHSQGAWSATKACLILRKTTAGELYFAAHNGTNAEWGKYTISNIDLENVELTFKYNGEKWFPEINGIMYSGIDCTEFVEGMITNSPTKTVIGFGPQCSGTNKHVIKNIKFSEKPEDTTEYAGWAIGNKSELAGTVADGWTLTAPGNIISETGVMNYYTSDIAVSNLKISMDVSELTVGKNLWLMFGDSKENIGLGAWSEKRISLCLRKTADGGLYLSAYDGTSEWGKTTIANFDFTNLEFTFEYNGEMWKPAINGIMYDIDCTEFVEGMIANSSTKTVIGLGPQCDPDDAYVIKNIKISEKSENTDDLTGWVRANEAEITGTPADGWDLTFGGSVFDNASYINRYNANIGVSKLQMSMNLSELAENTNLWIFFGNKAHSWEEWSDTSSSFILKKMLDGSLELCGHSGKAQWGTARIPKFDFTKTHTFEFVQVDGEWQFAVDGVAYEINGVDKFVEGMMKASPDKTVIGFGPQNAAGVEHVLKDVKFTEKEYKEVDWSCIGNVAVTGERESGYKLYGLGYSQTRYVHKLKPQDTTVSFKLKKETAQTNVILLSEDPTMGLLPGAEEMKDAKGMVLLIEQKDGKTYLQYWDEGHKDKVLFLEKFDEFDFDATHTITFKNEHGNWYLVFDGKVLRSYQLNDLVENMLTAEEGVYYRFSGWQNAYTFENVKFAHTPADASETSNWNVVGYEMSGKGDALSFKGDGYASWKKPVDLTKTSIETQFKPANGGWVSITVSDMETSGAAVLPGLVVPEDDYDAISFIFGRQNETDLRVSLYGTNSEGKKTEYLITLLKNFDFDATHEIRFVEKNDNYYLAIDGQILQWPNHDGDNKYITTALNECLKKVEKEAYFRFLNDQALGAEWGNITIVEEPFTEAEIFVDGDVTVGQNKNGLSANGIGTLGINKPFDVKNSKLSVQFKPALNNWVALTIGDTASPMVNFFVGPGNDHDIMTFILARQKNNVLRISLLDDGQEKIMMAISYFDFDATHTFSFVEHRGKYYLAIDDRMIEAVMSDGDDEVVTTWITKAVKSLSKETAYVRFVSPYETAQLSNISWKGMGTINGINYGNSPRTGDSVSIQPIVYMMVVSTSVIGVFGVQKHRRRKTK